MDTATAVEPTSMVVGYLIPQLYNPTSHDHPKCLLFNHKKNTFKVKEFTAWRRGDAFRSLFDRDEGPIFPFTWIQENVYNGSLKAVIGPKIEEMPHTTVSTDDLMGTLSRTQRPIKECMRSELNLWAEMTERDYVMKHAFSAAFLRDVRGNIVKYFGLEQPRSGGGCNFYIPTKLNTLFVNFERVDMYSWIHGQNYEPDTVIMWQKIVKYVMEEVCPYVKVCLFDNLKMEQTLARCLPTGSYGRGAELYYPAHDPPNEKVVFRGCVIDPKMYNVKPRPGTGGEHSYKLEMNKATIFVKTGLINHVVQDDDDAKETDDSNLIDNATNQMKLIAGAYREGQTSDFFKNQAVVFTTPTKDNAMFCTLDFSNFYATVLDVFGIDPYISRVLTKMAKLRKRYPVLKQWIVSIIGKMRHYDPDRYYKLKALSVAVVVNTINANGSIVCGATTDGLLVRLDGDEKIDFVYPASFPIKLEFIPRPEPRAVMKNVNNYVGVALDGSVVHRGFIGRNPGSTPHWFRDVVAISLEHCLMIASGAPKDENLVMKKILEVLDEKATRPVDFQLEDCGKATLPSSQKMFAVNHYCNDLNTGSNQFFAVIDDLVIDIKGNNNNNNNLERMATALPKKQSGWCIKTIDRAAYETALYNYLKKIAVVFEENQNCIDVLEVVGTVVKGRINSVLRTDQACYPGGVCYPL